MPVVVKPFLRLFAKCSFEVLYAAYKTARAGKRNKLGTALYEANALACTERLSYILRNKAYIPSKFETFYVYNLKKRLVQAPAFVDKVVQHALVDNILYDAIIHSFIQDSFASQTWKGMHVGLARLREQMQEYYQKHKGQDGAERRAAGLPHRPREEWDYASGWIPKADVHHFFASIDHDILREKLRRRDDYESVPGQLRLDESPRPSMAEGISQPGQNHRILTGLGHPRFPRRYLPHAGENRRLGVGHRGHEAEYMMHSNQGFDAQPHLHPFLGMPQPPQVKPY